MPKTILWNRDFISISISSFFIFITFYMLAVTLPSFVLDELHGSNQQVGLVTTVFVIAGVIFRPLTGLWFDELNRKKIIFYSLALFTVCSLLYLTIHSFSMLLILRTVHGVGFGIAATVTSAIAIEIIPEQRRGEGIGYFSLFMSLAMVIGPFLGLTLLSHYHFTVLFVACSVFSLLAFASSQLTRIPLNLKLHNQPAIVNSYNWLRFIEPKAIPISLAGSILAFSYGAISTFISVYAKFLGMEQMASYFFMVFAAIILLSRPFTGKLFDRAGEHVLVYPGIALFVIGMLWLSQVHTVAIFLVTGAIIGLGFGALLPSFQTIAVQSSPSHRRGLAIGTYFMLFDSGYGLGSFILGIIAAKSDYRTMYVIGGLIVACTAFLYYMLHHRRMNDRLAQRTSG
jgi:MFS family permease